MLYRQFDSIGELKTNFWELILNPEIAYFLSIVSALATEGFSWSGETKTSAVIPGT
jgi:hypothetical protein